MLGMNIAVVTPWRKVTQVPNAEATYSNLRSFLRVCRARLQPEQVGLQSSRRRRVPGLTRGDVAELVGVTERWYASFEAGNKDHPVSPAFVHRVAEALRLDTADRVWLFRFTLPAAAAVAEHFETELAQAERALVTAQAAAGHALAVSYYNHLVAEESLRQARAASEVSHARKADRRRMQARTSKFRPNRASRS